MASGLLAAFLVTAQPPQAHHHPAATPTGAERALFQSDMTLMAGMTPRDPMGAMAADGWQTMTMGIGRLVYNHQGGPSGDQASSPRTGRCSWPSAAWAAGASR